MAQKKDYIYLRCDYFTCDMNAYYGLRYYNNPNYNINSKQPKKEIMTSKPVKTMYFKTTLKEYKKAEIELKFILFNEDIIKTKNCKTRAERLARDLFLLQKNHILVGIYRFDLGENILKDDIENEIKKYMIQNINEKSLLDYSVKNLVLKN